MQISNPAGLQHNSGNVTQERIQLADQAYIRVWHVSYAEISYKMK